MSDSVPATIPFDVEKSSSLVAGDETGLVPVKQLLRWQDDGGALPRSDDV